MQASTRGTTRRCNGEMPSTSMASISSRIFREPRSAQIAEPPAPEISSATTMGDASRTMASTEADPVNDCAPSCRVRLPSCSAMTAPNGIDTSIVGRIVTLAMNHDCWMNSRVWKGRLNVMRKTSRNSAKRRPDCRTPAAGEGKAISCPSAPRPDGLSGLLTRLFFLPLLLRDDLTDRPLGRQRQGVQHVEHALLAAPGSLALGQPRARLDLRRHAHAAAALRAGAVGA